MRPESLFPLYSPLRTLPGVGPKVQTFIAKVAGGENVVDLLWVLPTGLVDRRNQPQIAHATPGTIATIKVQVEEHHKPPNRRMPYKVRVIDDEGENLGVMYTREAMEQANDKGLNLVEVSPGADPPVCKFLDVGKYRYEAQKKANAARKTQKTQDIKEVKMRPNIDTHDYDVKMRNVNKFIDNGDKVKVTLRFRGREMAHQHLGMDLLKRVQEDVEDIAKVEAFPRLEGRQMLMVLAPK